MIKRLRGKIQINVTVKINNNLFLREDNMMKKRDYYC